MPSRENPNALHNLVGSAEFKKMTTRHGVEQTYVYEFNRDLLVEEPVEEGSAIFRLEPCEGSAPATK